MEVLKIEPNIIKWSGFYNNPTDAQKHLEDQTKNIAQNRGARIVSSTKTLVNRKCHGLFLYKFTVIIALGE